MMLRSGKSTCTGAMLVNKLKPGPRSAGGRIWIPVAVLVSLIAGALQPVQAESMQCNGELISPGDTQERVLSVCGSPDERNGSDWVYNRQGDLPRTITFGQGIVMSIVTGENADFQNPSPLGDHL